MFAARGHRDGAFTIIELLVSLLVVGILISLAFFGFVQARRTAKNLAFSQTAKTVKLGVEAFRQEMGFLPPLVQDNITGNYPDFGNPEGPLDDSDSANHEPVTYLGKASRTDVVRRQKEEDYLKGYENGSRIDPNASLRGDYRYSVYSLAYYLVGALGDDSAGPIDGLGEGLRQVNRDGTFNRRGRDYTRGFVDVDNRRLQLAIEDLPAGRVSLVDANGVGIRYYRWTHGDLNGDIGSIDDANVPSLFFDDPANDGNEDLSPAMDNPKLRDAGYAIVVAGADKVFGDFGTEDAAEVRQILGVSDSLSDIAVERRARQDNAVEVGQ